MRALWEPRRTIDEEVAAAEAALLYIRQLPDADRALSHMVSNVDPRPLASLYALEGLWEQVRDVVEGLHVRIVEEHPSLSGKVGQLALIGDWHGDEDHPVEQLLRPLRIALEPAIGAATAFFHGDPDRRAQHVSVLEKLFRILPDRERLHVASAVMTSVECLMLWGLTPVGEVRQYALREALTDLDRVLRQACVDHEVATSPTLLDLMASPSSISRPALLHKYGEGRKESAMAFFHRIYDPIPFSERPFADEVRNQDLLLYKRLSSALARNKDNERGPSAISHLFPVRSKAIGGADHWPRDARTLVENDTKRRKRNRERMKIYRKKLKSND